MFGFSLKSQILYNNCGTTIMQTNEKKRIKYSHAVAATGLGGGISHHAIQSILSIFGVTLQSCKKSYYTYQKKCQEVLEELRKRLENENIDIFFGKIASEDKDRVLEKWNHGTARIIITTTVFVQALWNYNKWNLNSTLKPCNLCDNCYMRNKENAKLIDVSTKVLEMLDIVETLTTQFEYQIIPKDVISVFNCANTIRFIAQIILYNLVIKEEEAKSQAALQEWSYWVRG
ncbi:11144_t:CDS:2, partial [Dentiscutata erythropus]